MLGPQDVSNLVDGMIFKQYAAENASLCHEILWRKMSAANAAARI